MDLMTWLRAEWDRVLGFSLIALGAVLLVLGYLGVSDSPYVAEQLSYIVSGGLGGLFLLGAGATLLILADLHDEWRKLDRVEAMLSGEIPFPARPQANGVSAAPAPAAASGAPATGPTVSAPPATAAPSPALMVETTLADPEARPGPGASRPGPTAAAVFRRERFTLGIGMLLAVAVLFGSWARASGVDDPKPAIAAVAVAIFGLLLVALGAVGSTLTVKRHVQLRKARLFSPWLAPSEEPIAAPVAEGALVVAPGLTRYHRAGCPSVAGLAVRPVERRSLPSGLAPCQLCDPDSAV
ncbi:MAG TPA: hypothetical protein VJ622_18760 [Acidimicrobiia bacterium]|nr:hypothetical protein [Acidimicrobiia bacterium]HMC80369.1 hypothetical protein [Acidimicrobiia bacterium]